MSDNLSFLWFVTGQFWDSIRFILSIPPFLSDFD